MSVSTIPSAAFGLMAHKLRSFFLHKGFLEVEAQPRRSILAACEDPTTVATYNYEGQVWPLPQTAQMWLEMEMLANPEPPGFFTLSTSYRQEPDPVPGRHETIFSMFEFEAKGEIDDLIKLEAELLQWLGFPRPSTGYPRGKYEDVCTAYQTTEIGHSEERRLEADHGAVFFLTDFPERTSPFWNMCRRADGTSCKVDVIIGGQETIGSAQRSVDPVQMRHNFETISEGGYAGLLYSKFGKERVQRELDIFLNQKFFPRCGGGIGMKRLYQAMRSNGLL